LRRGQIIASISFLSERWGKSHPTIIKFLRLLEGEDMIKRSTIYRQTSILTICNYEKYLWHNNIRTVKIFLNVSRKEQARRFLSRIEEPEKNWKFSSSDFEERKYWDEYQEAFEVAINKTATKEAPWYVVPADHKWYMRLVISEIILHTLKEMDPKYPVVTKERLAEFEGYRKALEEELGETKDKEKKEKTDKKDKKKEKSEKKEHKKKK
jgi:DNA-binding Lrp family transcriptional regulator